MARLMILISQIVAEEFSKIAGNGLSSSKNVVFFPVYWESVAVSLVLEQRTWQKMPGLALLAHRNPIKLNRHPQTCMTTQVSINPKQRKESLQTLLVSKKNPCLFRYSLIFFEC
jgi:hypothetical protein